VIKATSSLQIAEYYIAIRWSDSAEEVMQEAIIANRVAFETVNLELTLIQGTMSKLHQKEQRIESAFASKPEVACL
jgi:hypothetical protein